MTLSFAGLGFPFAFGIFQNYYSTHEPFKGSSSIAAIGTTAMVRFALSVFFHQYLADHHPREPCTCPPPLCSLS